MKTIEAVVVVLIVALGVSLVINYSLYVSNQQLKSAGSAFPQSAFTTDVQGLELSVALNATTIQPGQGIGVIISETNMLYTPNTVYAATDWQFSPLGLGSCGTTGSYPMGLAICQGYYTSSNISIAAPLEICNPYIFCPMVIMDIASYTFQPLSNMATVSTTNSTTLGFFFTMPINSTVVANGYWSMSSSGAELHSFSPGIYTVVGGDEWGQLVVLHFIAL